MSGGCWNCGVPLDPLVSFCSACGQPHDPKEADPDLAEDAHGQRVAVKQAVEWARDKLVLALFLLGATIVCRMLLLRKEDHDVFVGYELPYSLLEKKAIDPPQVVDLKPLPVPLPTYDPHPNRGAKKPR